MKVPLAVFLFAIVSQGIALSDTLHIPGDEPTIQAGIDAAENGDIVLVSPGVYSENLRFHGKAITVVSEEGPDTTGILGFFPQNPDHGSVVRFMDGEGTDSILEGFTLMGGKGTNGMAWDIEGFCGGGVVCADGSSPTLKNNIFYLNRIQGPGGGLFILDSSPEVMDCKFIENSIHSADDFCWGAGVFIQGPCSPILIRCTFDKNLIHEFSFPARGAGICIMNATPLLQDCRFYENLLDTGLTGTHEPVGGGGLYNQEGEIELVRCLFVKNKSVEESGGAICNFEGTIHITACVFIENMAGESYYFNSYGAAIFNEAGSLNLANCFFVSNQATPGQFSKSYGGAIYSLQGPVTMDHCSFSSNNAESGGAIGLDSSQLTAVNCIFWNNTPNEIDNETGTPASDISYSCIMNGHSGIGNIDTDPLFVDTAKQDFHLTYASPCRDMGDDNAILIPEDFEGDPRLAGSHTDMGADEFYTHLYCIGDFTPNSTVEAKFVDSPGTSPVGLFLSTQLLDPPLSLQWGDFYMGSPWLLVMLPSIPSNGILVITDTIPETPLTGYTLYLQALIGNKLTNMFPLEISPSS